MSTPIPIVNQVYRHFKGQNYVVVGLAKDASDGTTRVIYRKHNHADETWYSRSLADFCITVPVDDGRGHTYDVPRFAPLN